MDKNRNPVCRDGSKNVFCTYYGDCLDDAAKKSWQFWDCSLCLNNSLHDATIDISHTVNDTISHYNLPAEILRYFPGEF